MSEREPNMFHQPDDAPDTAGREKLEEQFKNYETLELYEGKLAVVDVKPEQEKSDVPVLVAPGWAASATVFKENILTIAEEGRRTIALHDFHGLKTEKVADFSNAELRKVAALIKTLDAKGIDRVDAIAHSEGGLYTTIAATLYPERFRNLVLVAPAGMIGKDSFPRLAVSFAHEIMRQTVDRIFKGKYKKRILRPVVESGKAVASNPLQAVQQVFAISGAQIHDMIKSLKEKGIGISIIHGIEDRAFPMKRVQKVGKSEQMHGFYSVTGGHNEIYLRAKEFSKLAEHALTALENRTIK